MLKITSNLSELNMAQLKLLYEESISKYAMTRYADMYENLQILNAEQDFYADVKAFFCVTGAEYALWDAEGQYISAIRLEPVADGYLLTSFETAPAARHKGYGTKLLSAVVEYITQDKKSCIYSHVDESNTTSLKVHLRCGFHSIEKPAVFVNGTLRTDHVTYIYDKK